MELQKFDLSTPSEAMRVAETLQKFVREKNLTANIKGKNYPMVEAWQFAGSQLGLYPLVISVNNISLDGEIKYSASVEIRRFVDDRKVSYGYAVCSNKEVSKKLFDEYAICSMAQTRAEGKAYRMLLSWLMKAAGFEATPAEEMDFMEERKEKPATSFNRKEIEKNGKPLIKNEQFKKACERINLGEVEVYQKTIDAFSLEEKQFNLLTELYNTTTNALNKK